VQKQASRLIPEPRPAAARLRGARTLLAQLTTDTRQQTALFGDT